ncbi:MAG: OadG family protein [Treponema sp.]|jgi:oxaloacetate decarboxylase gamma subunit|nr:OadG family protein [Treponema sp.]
MTIVEMLGQSGVLTLLGMGIVFGFLLILIICVTLIGRLIQAIGTDKDSGTPAQAVAPSGSANNGAVTAAISAAVDEYRKKNQ